MSEVGRTMLWGAFGVVAVLFGGTLIKMVVVLLPFWLAHEAVREARDYVDGTTALRQERAAATPGPERVVISQVRRIEEGIAVRKFFGVTLTLTNTSDIAITNPMVRCDYINSFFQELTEESGRGSSDIQLKAEFPTLRLAPGESTTVSLHDGISNPRSEWVTNLSCRVWSIDAKDVYRKVSRTR